MEWWNTSHAGRVGEDDDVIEGPAVLGVRRVKGQLPGGLLPQVYQHGGVDHRNGEAASSLLLPDGNVGRRALVVALDDQQGDSYSEGHTGCRDTGDPRSEPSTWELIPHQKLE